jgi:hypothetical protein
LAPDQRSAIGRCGPFLLWAGRRASSPRSLPPTASAEVLSADGKTLTFTTTGANASGQQINNVAVFEKQ